MSIESFGAVVSDNDGSAFITKAEFDSLKNNFQSQINQYNTSIDAKIDGAIASYLSGIKLQKTYEFKLPYETNNFWVYANLRPNIPHSISSWFYNNRPARNGAQRVLGTATKTVFDNYALGAPPIWIRSVSSAETYVAENGGFDDKIVINMTGNYDGSNYFNFPAELDRGSGAAVIAYIYRHDNGLNITTHDYEYQPTNYGEINMLLCQCGNDAIITDSAPNFLVYQYDKDGSTYINRIDQNNKAAINKDSINNYLNNISFSAKKYAPLVTNSDQEIFAIETNATNPSLYNFEATGLWAKLDQARMSGEHKVYLYSPNPRDLSATPTIKSQTFTDDKFFFGYDNEYTNIQRRTYSTDTTASGWITCDQSQILILPNSGIITGDKLFQSINDDKGNKFKSFGGIKIADKAEGDVSFKITLQSWGYLGTSKQLVQGANSYKIAAGKKPFTDGTTNTSYVKINNETNDVISLSANGTYDISIKDIKGEPLYFKIVPDNDRDIEVIFSDLKYTTE